MTASGEVVVEYSYDPWGNILAVTGSLASTLGSDNPFRYRGYYYDNESCFYYLNSRYYDAKVCRFVNADEPEIIDGANEHILENNLYAYCFNNPVNLTDDSGYWPSWAKKLVAAVAITACVVAATVVTCGAAAPALAAVGFGVVSSISASTVATAATVAVTSVSISATATVAVCVDEYLDNHIVYSSEHTKNSRKSTKEKHQKGRTRNKRDHQGEKGDARRNNPWGRHKIMKK